jgi:SanA protein
MLQVNLYRISVIVVTQEFHLPRAVFIARQLGIKAYGVTASTGNYSDRVILSNKIRETFLFLC